MDNRPRGPVQPMLKSRKNNTVVGLHIEAAAIAATEVRGNGIPHVEGAGVEPLEPGIFGDGEVSNEEALTDHLKTLFSANKLARRVRIGVGNQRVIVRTLRLPAIEDPKDLEAAVRFRAQEQIPMPLDQAVLDHQVVGGVPAQDGNPAQVDVAVIAARRDMVASFVEPVRKAGLDPVGIDLSAFGMIRALSPEHGIPSADAPVAEDAAVPAPLTVLYCHLGDVTNLAVARGPGCHFARVSSFGADAISAQLAETGGLTLAHARQWLSHVGLETPVEELDGDPRILSAARDILYRGAADLANELRLSLDYYAAQEAVSPVDKVVLCGPLSAIAGLAAELERNLGLAIEVARPDVLERFGPDTAPRLTLSYGLALHS